MTLTALWRWITNAHCEIPQCPGGRRCARYHVEVITCPVCKSEVDEFNPVFTRVMDSKMRSPWMVTPHTSGSSSSNSVVRLTFTGNSFGGRSHA